MCQKQEKRSKKKKSKVHRSRIWDRAEVLANDKRETQMKSKEVRNWVNIIG
jgi:hypothetical protein